MMTETEHRNTERYCLIGFGNRENGLQSKDYGISPKAGHSKGIDFLLEPPEGIQSCQQLDFGPTRLASDFRPSEIYKNKFASC